MVNGSKRNPKVQVLKFYGFEFIKINYVCLMWSIINGLNRSHSGEDIYKILNLQGNIYILNTEI